MQIVEIDDYRTKSKTTAHVFQPRKYAKISNNVQFKKNTNLIDPMHKWRQVKYSSVYIQISPTSLILGNIFF